MTKSYKEQFKEESARRKQRQQKRMAILIILIGVLVSGALWYLDSLSKERQVPPQQAVPPVEQAKEEPKAVPKAVPPEVPKQEEPKQAEADKPAYGIIIDKSDYKLYLRQDDKVVKAWGVAVGAKPGQKQKAGDMTTPTGHFEVDEVLDASYWTHDFGDGKGEIKGAYGPNFISLVTGWDGIGIHGTHDPASIGTMASEGCVRMRNAELLELLPYVKVGTAVTVRE